MCSWALCASHGARGELERASPPVGGPGGDCDYDVADRGEEVLEPGGDGFTRTWRVKGGFSERVTSALKSREVSRRGCTWQRQQPVQRPRGGKERNPRVDIRCEGQGWENHLYNLFLKVILEARLVQPIFTEFSL